jgi:hypothetical protein
VSLNSLLPTHLQNKRLTGVTSSLPQNSSQAALQMNDSETIWIQNPEMIQVEPRQQYFEKAPAIVWILNVPKPLVMEA